MCSNPIISQNPSSLQQTINHPVLFKHPFRYNYISYMLKQVINTLEWNWRPWSSLDHIMVAFQLYKVFPFFLFLSQQKRGSLYKNHTVQWPTFCSTYLEQGNVWENCGIVFGQYSIGTSCCLCHADQHRQFSPPAAQNHPPAKPQRSHTCTAHTNTHTPHIAYL